MTRGSTARLARRGRPKRDLLLGAVAAVALHGAFFASGALMPPVAPTSDPLLLVEAGAVAPLTLDLAADEPPPASVPAEDLAAYVSGDSVAVPEAAIVPLDLLRPQVGSFALSHVRFMPTVGGMGNGFHVGTGALQLSGWGTRLPVFELVELDQPPVVLDQPLPQYPPALLRTGARGEVTVTFIVMADGAVRAVRIESATQPEFVAPALQAVARWKFRPGRKDGRAVATRVEVPIAFSVPGRP